MDNKNIDIVVLYAQADQTYWEELRRHLIPQTRIYPNVELWSVGELEAGLDRAEETRRRLRRADISLLLLSADFATDDRLDEETRALLSSYRSRRGSRRFILPVIVKDFLWQDYYDNAFDLEELTVFQNLPAELDERDIIYKDIARRIVEYIEYINETPLQFTIPTWVGYLGGIHYNRGFSRNTETSLYTRYQRTMRFNINDDKEAICEAWLRGETQLIPATIDLLPYFVDRLRDHKLRLIYQASWSNGADAILVRDGIQRKDDLSGKRILYPRHTPAHTFLQYVLREAGIDYASIDAQGRDTSDLDELAEEFQEDDSLDAVVLWSPYLEACQEAMPEARVLTDTGDYPNLIADLVLAGEEFIEMNRDELLTLFTGWAAEIDRFATDPAHREAGLQTLVGSIMEPLPSIIPSRIQDSLREALHNYFSQSLDKVHLCTLQDNLEFFGLADAGDEASRGEKIYQRFLAIQYPEFAQDPAFQWNAIVDDSLLRAMAVTAG